MSLYWCYFKRQQDQGTGSWVTGDIIRNLYKEKRVPFLT